MSFTSTFSICVLVATGFPVPYALAQGASGMQEEVPAAAYFAGIKGTPNRDRILPDLDYWGVGPAVWGSASAKKTLISSSRRCQVGTNTCTFAYNEGADGQLKNVSYSFAKGVTSRSALVGIFKQLHKDLVERYGAPTHNIAAPEEFRGQDAFVQGLDNRYEVGWSGSHSQARLVLNPDELIITFNPTSSPQADPALREREFQAFQKVFEKLPGDHPLKRSGSR